MSLRVNIAIFPASLWRWAIALFFLCAATMSAQTEPEPPEPISEEEIVIEEPSRQPASTRRPSVRRTMPGLPNQQEEQLDPTNASVNVPGGRGAPEAIRQQTIELVMVDQDLNSVLLYLEKLKGKPIIRSQSLTAVKINFDGLGPMSYDEAILAIESLLALNGVIITDMGDGFLKAVPVAGGQGPATQTPPFIHGSALDLPPSTAYYTKFFKFSYLDAEKEGTTVVNQLGTGSQPIVFPKNNALLVTDMLTNLQRMEEVLQTADTPDFDTESIFFFSLKHIKAADLSQRLTKLTTGNSGIARYFNNNTTFEADERTNQLIAITHKSNKSVLENLISELDKDVEPITSSEVFYIKHAQATEIDTLLEEVISGQKDARDKTESAKKTTSPETRTAPGAGGRDALVADAAPLPSPTEGISSAVVDLGKNLQFSDFVTIVADERSNAIVAYGTKTDLIQIERLIDQIDVLLAQVYIEVLIAEVTLTDDEVSGFSQFAISGTPGLNPLTILDPIGAGGQVQGTGNSNNGLNPINFTATLNPDEFSLVISTAQKNSNVRILSVPNIVTTHNQEANVNVSQSQPIITSSVNNLSTGSATGTTSNDVQYRDIGIQLKVKPLIGSNGIIQMEIEQIVENVVDNTEINGIPQPIIGKREATSFVSVADGQVIVLAGLQETSFNTTDGKLWIIGDIPIIGDLLNPESDSNNRRELMIFIRPTVYFGPNDAYKHAQKRVQALDNGMDVDTYLRTNNMSEVSSQVRDEALEQSLELEDYSGWEHPLEANYLPKDKKPDSDDESESESESEPTAHRSPYRGN